MIESIDEKAARLNALLSPRDQARRSKWLSENSIRQYHLEAIGRECATGYREVVDQSGRN